MVYMMTRDWALTLIFDNGSWKNENDFNFNNSTYSLPGSKMFSLLTHVAMRRLGKLLSLFFTVVISSNLSSLNSFFCCSFKSYKQKVCHSYSIANSALNNNLLEHVQLHQPFIVKLPKGVCHATKVCSLFPQLNSSWPRYVYN